MLAEQSFVMPWTSTVNGMVPRPSPNYGYGEAKPHWRAVTWHISEGTLDGTLSWLTSRASEASAHLVIARDGTIYRLVPFSEAAWAQGNVCMPDRRNPVIDQTVRAGINPNLVSYSIECVGMSGHGTPGSLTAPQEDALVRATAYFCVRSGLSSDRTHILGHYQWDSCTRQNCPGFAPLEWGDWVGRVHALTQFWRGW